MHLQGRDSLESGFLPYGAEEGFLVRELTIRTDSWTSVAPVLVCTTPSVELAVPLGVADPVINASLECTTTMCYRSCGEITWKTVSIDGFVGEVAGSMRRCKE